MVFFCCIAQYISDAAARLKAEPEVEASVIYAITLTTSRVRHRFHTVCVNEFQLAQKVVLT